MELISTSKMSNDLFEVNQQQISYFSLLYFFKEDKF